ncbi:MAG: DEAD/DEAH box helicase [Candidatus Kapaibacterium sp.]
MTLFRELGLSKQILRGVQDAGYTAPTPIQAAAVPVLMEGHDLTGCAQTGTGKTASFVLPMLERLSANHANSRRRAVRALVVVPTRELALQVDDSVRTYGKSTGLRSIAVYGGVSMEPQYRAFRQGVDIVIATPGRLLDHVNRRSLDLSNVEMLVLDEADRMFDMGFINDIKKIVSELPEDRQTVLFSATMPKAIRQLAETIQREPKLIEIGERRNPAATVEQHIYTVSQDRKVDLLLHLLQSESIERVLVFTRTKHRADRIALRLNKERIRSVAIHSNRTQNQRQQALDGFRKGKFQVMAATDVAARGIDVDNISHVINFDTPRSPEDYIHRIGRTGRAESTGDAMTFVAQDELGALRSIEKLTGKKITRQTVEGVTGEFSGRDERSNGSSRRSYGNSSSNKSYGNGRSSNRSNGNGKSSKPTRGKSEWKDSPRGKSTDGFNSTEGREFSPRDISNEAPRRSEAWIEFSRKNGQSFRGSKRGDSREFGSEDNLAQGVRRTKKHRKSSEGVTSEKSRRGKSSGGSKKGYRKSFGGKVG